MFIVFFEKKKKNTLLNRGPFILNDLRISLKPLMPFKGKKGGFLINYLRRKKEKKKKNLYMEGKTGNKKGGGETSSFRSLIFLAFKNPFSGFWQLGGVLLFGIKFFRS